jgi:hypothetical protein
MDGKRSQWASVAALSQVIKVKDEEMLSSAITLAAQKGWLMVGGQPVHSVLLTDKGEAVALKKSGHSNAPMASGGLRRLTGPTKCSSESDFGSGGHAVW